MQVEKIPLSEILPDPMNPRKTFDEAKLKELADNIKAQGLLQPITVRPIECCSKAGIPTLLNVDNKYAIVCGERRYRACKLLAEQEKDKRATILAIVRSLNDDEAFDAMITENLQRKDVDPVEEAFAFGQLMKKGGTAEDIALRFGKSVRFVQDRIKLNNLIPELLLMVKEGVMPISAGMIIAKLDEDTQRKFYEENGRYDNVSKYNAERFIDNLFMSLSRAPWSKAPNFKGGCGRACSECHLNTANAGCLFWEMKSTDGGKCTSREKFESKRMAWLLHLLDREKSSLVRKGEPLEVGKTIVVDTDATLFGEEAKERHEYACSIVEGAGYEMVKPSVFDHRCFYSEESDEMKKLIAEGKVYRCISPFNSFGSCGIEPRIVYYYPKKAAATDGAATVGIPAEVLTLVQKHKRSIEICNEKFAEEYRRMATNLGEAKRRGPISDDEGFALDCLILQECGDAMLNRYGLKKYGSKASEYMDVVKGNQADRNLWYREWLRVKFSSTAMYAGTLTMSMASDVLREWLPKETSEYGEKSVKALDRKLEKIREKLAELGYDINGKKIK